MISKAIYKFINGAWSCVFYNYFLLKYLCYCNNFHFEEFIIFYYKIVFISILYLIKAITGSFVFIYIFFKYKKWVLWCICETFTFLCYNKNYQQMWLFVLCLYFLFLVFSLHVSALHGPIIRRISSCSFYATIWFLQCFVDRVRASEDWFVVVTSVYTEVTTTNQGADARKRSTKHCMNQMVA